MTESTDISARAKAIGVTTTLSGPMRISVAALIAAERQADALQDLADAAVANAESDRLLIEETCATALALATPSASQTPTSLIGRLLAMLTGKPA